MTDDTAYMNDEFCLMSFMTFKLCLVSIYFRYRLFWYYSKKTMNQIMKSYFSGCPLVWRDNFEKKADTKGQKRH